MPGLDEGQLAELKERKAEIMKGINEELEAAAVGVPAKEIAARQSKLRPLGGTPAKTTGIGGCSSSPI